MDDYYEENPKNPTIANVENINVKHHFIIRHISEGMKKQMREIILQLVNEHEISDFYIEEKKGYKTNRIIYNYHTLVTEHDDFDFNEVDKRFVKHLH